MDHYESFSKVGEGAFGVVFRARDTRTGDVVAIKRVARARAEEGTNFATLREVKLLMELQHPNVVRLHEVFFHERDIHVVYEFYDGDLEMVIRKECSPTHYSPADIKAYLQMILRGVAYLHSVCVLHRDLKPNNVFLSAEGKVALGDFGLARLYGDNKPLSPQAITIFYRPPEMLFGSRHYGPAVDVWSIGCIFAELWLSKPLFPGMTELEVLSYIFAILGSPSETDWPGVTSLCNYIEFEKANAVPLQRVCPAATPAAIHLLSAMLRCNPNDRITCADALKHPYFSEEPKPSNPNRLPKPLPVTVRKQLQEQQQHDAAQRN